MATSVPLLVFLSLSVLDLGPMYATDVIIFSWRTNKNSTRFRVFPKSCSDPVQQGIYYLYLIYAGGFISPMQRCFSYLVCQPLVTSFVIDAYLCLAMLHAWTLEYQHMMLCV